MSDNIINFENQLLKNQLKNYEEDLKTNYLIIKRKEEQDPEMKSEIRMEQYDLFNMHTHEAYMDLTVFSNLGLINVTFAKSKVSCALAFNPDKSIVEYETISIDDIEEMITYIQFTETDLYTDALEPFPKLALIKESPFYEQYLHVLTAIRYCITSAAKLYT